MGTKNNPGSFDCYTNAALDENRLEADTFHRVDLLYPKKGCWTLFEMEPREQPWSFWDRNTGETLPHQDYEVVGDGKTVWVNGAKGECIARFGQLGIDIHRPIDEQKEKGQCFVLYSRPNHK